MHHNHEAAIRTIVNLESNNNVNQYKELRLHNRYDEKLWLAINGAPDAPIQSAEKVLDIINTKYIVTGSYVRGGKFRNVYSSRAHAMCINLYNGRVWEEKTFSDGSKKRRLIKHVVN